MTYQLCYLNIRGRGEPIRWILKAVGADFTDDRIDMFTEWPNRKEEFSWGQTPVLVVDGEHLGQTVVICKYLGEKHQLATEDAWTAARQLAAAEYLHDVSTSLAFAFVFRLKQDEVQQQQFLSNLKNRLPVVLKNLEEHVSPEGWILSPEMTWVDVFVAAYLDQYQDVVEGLLDDLPKLKGLSDQVRELPAIKEWLEERPPYHQFESPEGL